MPQLQIYETIYRGPITPCTISRGLVATVNFYLAKYVSRVFFSSRFSLAWMVKGVHNIYNPEV